MLENINFDEVIFDWSDSKNILLFNERWVCFEDIVFAIKESRLIDIIINPSSNFDNQYCLLINIDDYIYLVPFIIESNKIFLKTIFPSRKFNKKYL
jgi:hypothetical protein